MKKAFVLFAYVAVLCGFAWCGGVGFQKYVQAADGISRGKSQAAAAWKKLSEAQPALVKEWEAANQSVESSEKTYYLWDLLTPFSCVFALIALLGILSEIKNSMEIYRNEKRLRRHTFMA